MMPGVLNIYRLLPTSNTTYCIEDHVAMTNERETIQMPAGHLHANNTLQHPIGNREWHVRV